MKNYDTNFRLEQVKRREEELYAMKTFILSNQSFPASIRSVIDPTQVFVGGFSYGAATSSLSVVRHPEDYKGAILIDGWFSINLADMKEAKVMPNNQLLFDFPPAAHEMKLPLPAIFIGSEKFSKIPHLNDATVRLAQGRPSKCSSCSLDSLFK